MRSKWLECDVGVGARQAGLSISETADLLGFSHTTISRLYREWSEKEKISSEGQFCWWKCLVDSRGQRRAGRKATVMQITTHYNRGMQKSISKHTTLKQMVYSSRRQRVPLLSAKNRKLHLFGPSYACIFKLYISQTLSSTALERKIRYCYFAWMTFLLWQATNSPK